MSELVQWETFVSKTWIAVEEDTSSLPLASTYVYICVHMLIREHAPPHTHTKKNAAFTQNLNSPLTTHILYLLETVHIKHWSVHVKILGLNLGRNHSGVPCGCRALWMWLATHVLAALPSVSPLVFSRSLPVHWCASLAIAEPGRYHKAALG